MNKEWHASKNYNNHERNKRNGAKGTKLRSSLTCSNIMRRESIALYI